MKQRRLGRTGLVASEIGIGTMTFGSMADETTSHAILDCAIDHGINFIDTAEMYPVPPNPKWSGRTEEVVGKWLAGRSRDSILLATKVIDQAGLDKARNFAKAIGVEVRDALVQQKLAKYEAVLPAYAESIGLPYLDLDDVPLDPKLIAAVPPMMAR